MFQAARALLATKGLDSAKHSGVIALFNREFVKPQIVARDMGKQLRDAFELRIESDYEDFRPFTLEEAQDLSNDAIPFVKACRETLDSLP